MSKVIFNEGAAPGTPAANKVAVYAKAGGGMYKKDDTGTEAALGGLAAVVDDATPQLGGNLDLNSHQLEVGEQTLTDAAGIDWDMDNGPSAKVTLGGNRTLNAPSNHKAGSTYMLRVIQDGTGNRTLAYNAVFLFPGGTDPTLSTGAGDIDILSFYSDGTNLYGSFLGDFS